MQYTNKLASFCIGEYKKKPSIGLYGHIPFRFINLYANTCVMDLCAMDVIDFASRSNKNRFLLDLSALSERMDNSIIYIIFVLSHSEDIICGQ